MKYTISTSPESNAILEFGHCGVTTNAYSMYWWLQIAHNTHIWSVCVFVWGWGVNWLCRHVFQGKVCKDMLWSWLWIGKCLSCFLHNPSLHSNHFLVHVQCTCNRGRVPAFGIITALRTVQHRCANACQCFDALKRSHHVFHLYPHQGRHNYIIIMSLKMDIPSRQESSLQTVSKDCLWMDPLPWVRKGLVLKKKKKKEKKKFSKTQKWGHK